MRTGINIRVYIGTLIRFVKVNILYAYRYGLRVYIGTLFNFSKLITLCILVWP